MSEAPTTTNAATKSTKQAILDKAKIIDQELDKFGTFTSLEKRTGIPKTTLLAGLCFVLVFMLVFGFGVNIIGHMISLIWPAYRSYIVIDALEKLNLQKKTKAGQLENHHVYGRAKADQLDEYEVYVRLRAQLNMRARQYTLDHFGTDQNRIEIFLEKERSTLMACCHKKTKKYLMYWVVYGVFYLFEYVFKILMWWVPFYFVLKIAFLLWCVHPKYEGSGYVYQNIFAPFIRARRPFIEGWIVTARKLMQTTFDEVQKDAQEAMPTGFNAATITDAVKVLSDQTQLGIEKVRKLTAQDSKKDGAES